MNEPIKGIVHGRVIELAGDSGLPDGQEVVVSLQPVAANGTDISEDFKNAFGAWADAGKDFDQYLEASRQLRKIDRPDIVT
jgi:hypothetical protein